MVSGGQETFATLNCFSVGSMTVIDDSVFHCTTANEKKEYL